MEVLQGSAHDGRVLRDALLRPNGLKVPKGYYYLCDAGYSNSEGFLAPYRGQRYHLKEWGMTRNRPRTPEELFNMRHSQARNTIEIAFGVLKMRWAIFIYGVDSIQARYGTTSVEHEGVEYLTYNLLGELLVHLSIASAGTMIGAKQINPTSNGFPRGAAFVACPITTVNLWMESLLVEEEMIGSDRISGFSFWSDELSALSTWNITFGQFTAVICSGERQSEVASVEEPAVIQEAPVPLIDATHADAPEAPVVEEFSADTAVDVGNAEWCGDGIPTIVRWVELGDMSDGALVVQDRSLRFRARAQSAIGGPADFPELQVHQACILTSFVLCIFWPLGTQSRMGPKEGRARPKPMGSRPTVCSFLRLFKPRHGPPPRPAFTPDLAGPFYYRKHVAAAGSEERSRDSWACGPHPCYICPNSPTKISSCSCGPSAGIQAQGPRYSTV
ncbi:hypothetical protein LINPERPRIM_LOCUS29151 [Linum perenne]